VATDLLTVVIVAGLALVFAVPLSWKWQLGVGRVAAAVTVLAAVAHVVLLPADLGPIAAVAAGWALTIAGAVGILAYRFYRDPERTPPSGEVVVSPADGTVVYVRRYSGGRLPVATKHGRDYSLDELTRAPLVARNGYVVGIGMSFLDVHVNRAPIAGEVALRRHFPGLFGSLRDPEMVLRNERATTLIRRGRLEVAVVQIASRLVRQIVGFVREGDAVAVGQRIGVIRLGSQVDVVLPEELVDIVVRPGQRVRAGESVLATIRQAES
jgi:phosphatidylserine decarboxylase